MDYLEALEHNIPNHVTCRVTMPSNTTCRQRVALPCVLCLKSITLIIQEARLMGVNGYLRKEGRERCSGGEFELADLLAEQCKSACEKVNRRSSSGELLCPEELEEADSKVLVWEAGSLKLSLVSCGDV